MTALSQRIEAQLRKRFSKINADAAGQLPAGMFDPVFTYLDELIEIVASIRDYSSEPYLDKVRQLICGPQCTQDDSGRCPRRDAQTCALDSYFPIIVGIIEQEFKSDSGPQGLP